MNLKEESKAYEPPKTHNIAELEAVSLDQPILDGEGTNKKGETFKYKYILINDIEYRVPGIVLGDIKTMLSVKPNVKTIKVSKTGEGVGTKYRVDDLE